MHGDGYGNNSSFTQIFELKTTLPFHMVGQESKQVHHVADENEMLNVMALEVLRYIAASINPFCPTMADD